MLGRLGFVVLADLARVLCASGRVEEGLLAIDEVLGRAEHNADLWCVQRMPRRASAPRRPMPDGCRRVFGHSRIAGGGAGDDAFKEARHAAHSLDPVERRDKTLSEVRSRDWRSGHSRRRRPRCAPGFPRRS